MNTLGWKRSEYKWHLGLEFGKYSPVILTHVCTNVSIEVGDKRGFSFVILSVKFRISNSAIIVNNWKTLQRRIAGAAVVVASSQSTKFTTVISCFLHTIIYLSSLFRPAQGFTSPIP